MNQVATDAEKLKEDIEGISGQAQEYASKGRVDRTDAVLRRARSIAERNELLPNYEKRMDSIMQSAYREGWRTAFDKYAQLYHEGNQQIGAFLMQQAGCFAEKAGEGANLQDMITALHQASKNGHPH